MKLTAKQIADLFRLAKKLQKSRPDICVKVDFAIVEGGDWLNLAVWDRESYGKNGMLDNHNMTSNCYIPDNNYTAALQSLFDKVCAKADEVNNG